MAEQAQINMQQYNENGDLTLKATIEGQTEMPFWKHDLAFETVLALLDSIDFKDFREDGKEELFFKYIQKVKDLLDDI
ncbi:MAG: hypothetical protein ACO1OT_09305 [Heyndrickxia sp.]